MKQSDLKRAVETHPSIRCIADSLGCSYTNVRYWLKKHGLKSRGEHPKRVTYANAQFKAAVKNSISIAGVIRSMKWATVGSNYQRVKAGVARLGLSTNHWKGQAHGSSRQPTVPWTRILVKSSEYEIGRQRKERLIKEGMLRNRCAVCNRLPKWRGRSLVLRLDHINGDHYDNRLKNLRLVCPNCDSQLPTFCGRNKK